MDNTTHFGFKDVATQDKQGMVRSVFDSVANKYDLMNDVLSFGAHRLWKHYTIAMANVKTGDKVLDIAGGTGDLARAFAAKVGDTGQVVLSDINAAMLNEGRKNLINKGVAGVEFVQLSGEQIPFADNSFDCVSIAFGLRNVTDKDQCIREMYRVLKPGGCMLILEFSKTNIVPLEKFYDFYSFNVMPKLGKFIANDEESYQYLAESIRKHPDQETLKQMVLDAGFGLCEYHNLSGGIVALHKGIKIP
ncbi:Ubiquinone/menaquinone biosynthesis methyltransferase UbiE [Bathymodiolus thermophilus thioautotrophic gill symbiont]|uniref:Ubiquinone/menaquinone biosynthesis C-methyltransferase UbiE n=1 Tax=Bathymodiolus thermophilus thioautotrophic gill symbiont TaxID=2360 RepID=A0A1J5U6W9_9GAMM|nr:bifunctional demethylmenaquinone methyltransferase/2-methoxy-6-polyprenyl-1,4-benzoquinol methylase UbiE [Bathymodiolus thermophilus thioautotrophic gill symbiont]OIR24558.1 bifunctional demethylmenaquinone methyltransferase/2-methoxy-6-polyprenyl-1,4-benzoquinol methylase [Bathymodiolus thermophilus thioautotrophic gill symbiont]SHA15892.1 Ubiquinone/menaquinone biosynthesis methyltransferase UbiE [Bathymodiolus thermophilus thioautotrophic gill symbiont]